MELWAAPAPGTAALLLDPAFLTSDIVTLSNAEVGIFWVFFVVVLAGHTHGVEARRRSG